VFLHGFGGSFALPCWQLAKAALPMGYVTRCPATGPEGDWWEASGEAIVRDLIDELRREGYRKIVLVGLSNGAVGAARLAPKFRAQLAGVSVIQSRDIFNHDGAPVCGWLG
jgi:pimeloyl-ACP methyl ester carboxylesterase